MFYGPFLVYAVFSYHKMYDQEDDKYSSQEMANDFKEPGSN